MSLELLQSIIENPIPFAHALGYTKLKEDPHKDWIKKMFFLEEDGTLQAHRGAYKTSCLIISLSLRIIAKPFENTILLRKASQDVTDVISAVSKILHSEMVMSLLKGIYGAYPSFTADSGTEIEISVYNGAMGRQLLGLGLKSSITGKHGSVITDDIVTVKDRVSSAERTATKNTFLELTNIASESHHTVFNCGTPWHKDDAFSLMPKPERHTVYETGIKTEEEIQEIKSSMPSSLYAANYELKHIADGDVLFPEPEYGKFPIGSKAYAHIDAAYGGSDSCSLTIMSEVGTRLHMVGWKMEGHIDNHMTSICSKLERFQVVGCALEDNADKGYLRKELGPKTATKLTGYHESMNKYYKISSFGKSRWKDVIFDLEEGDAEYVESITDYNENSEHDDCPDSYASLVRWKFKGKKITSYH